MTLSTILQNLSAYSIILPVALSIIYFLKCGFRYDKRINLVGIYLILALGAQALMIYLAMNGQSNLLIARIFILVEMLLLGYFLLSIQIKSFLPRIGLTLILTIVVLLVDLIWGETNAMPIETILLESLIITILGMASIPALRVDNKHENSFYYFVFGIMIYSVNNLIGYGFIELAPGFSLVIHGIVNLAKNLIISWGLFLVIRNKMYGY